MCVSKDTCGTTTCFRPNGCACATSPICNTPPIESGGCIAKDAYCSCADQGLITAGDCCCITTPIIVDVEGDGFQLTDLAGGVNFDFNGDGVRGPLSWTKKNTDDAFLVLDRDESGKIERGAELFGNVTPQPESENKNGFLALAEYDKVANGGNGNGRIDRSDVVFTKLRLWQDLDHNGKSEARELKSLESVGLGAIDLDYKVSKRIDKHGNQFRYRAKVRSKQGADIGRWAWDIGFLMKTR